MKPKYQSVVERGSYFVPSTQHQGPFLNRPDLSQELCQLLLKMRDAVQALNVEVVQPIIQGFIIAREPKVLEKCPVSLHWTRTFMKTHLKWSYRCATIACGKLPLDWQQQGPYMAYRATYLVKAYDIPQALVVNTDQTFIISFFKVL